MAPDLDWFGRRYLVRKLGVESHGLLGGQVVSCIAPEARLTAEIEALQAAAGGFGYRRGCPIRDGPAGRRGARGPAVDPEGRTQRVWSGGFSPVTLCPVPA